MSLFEKAERGSLNAVPVTNEKRPVGRQQKRQQFPMASVWVDRVQDEEVNHDSTERELVTFLVLVSTGITATAYFFLIFVRVASLMLCYKLVIDKGIPFILIDVISPYHTAKMESHHAGSTCHQYTCTTGNCKILHIGAVSN